MFRNRTLFLFLNSKTEANVTLEDIKNTEFEKTKLKEKVQEKTVPEKKAKLPKYEDASNYDATEF